MDLQEKENFLFGECLLQQITECLNLSMYNGHCFCTKDLDALANFWGAQILSKDVIPMKVMRLYRQTELYKQDRSLRAVKVSRGQNSFFIREIL